jgi:hypothetical protein
LYKNGNTTFVILDYRSFYAEILPRDFGIGEEQLTVMTRDHNYSALQEYGGACIIIFGSKFQPPIYGQPIKA